MSDITIATASAGLEYPGPPPVRALEGITISATRGERVAIVGRSGSGKSSLLSLLGLLERPTAGDVLIGGRSTAGLSDKQLAAHRSRHLGFVFQDHLVSPHLTVRESLELAMRYRDLPRSERDAEARRVLGFVGLADKTSVRGRTLSGGERQRVSIARALIGRVDILLCDEPTGNLDSANAQNVLDLLHQAAADGATVLVVTHDETVAAAMDRRITIVDGSVADA